MNQEDINTCKGWYKNLEPKREDVPTKYILKFKCEFDGLNYVLKTKFATTWLYMGIQSHVRGVSDEIWFWSLRGT